MRLILLTFTTKFNWAYHDGFSNKDIGQTGYGFSLILLSKYGHKKRLDSFYAEKYCNAFPSLLDSIKPTYSPLEIYATNCYSLRTFKRFLNHFGLIKIHTQGFGFEGKTYITKTDLYDKLIKCVPHKIFSTPTYLTSLN
ncbi:MAG: hypothetical protein M0Q41_00955 [Bacteroidales bacterium]|nr:hypothetical protein [Bacteroidales bacterium]